jgi:hypothetical protein
MRNPRRSYETSAIVGMARLPRTRRRFTGKPDLIRERAAEGYHTSSAGEEEAPPVQTQQRLVANGGPAGIRGDSGDIPARVRMV